MLARKKKIHEEARQRMEAAYLASKDERQMSLSDRRFCSISGAQWEGDFGEQYGDKVRLEVDKIHLSLIRIYNEYRNNRISARFVGRHGDESDDLAEFCEGLYRADEEDSVSEEAYDTAFEEGVAGGFGAWRLRVEYEDEYDEDNDRMRIRFESIPDADRCVFFDPGAKRQDKSDAQWCIVLTGMTREAYEAEYDDKPDSWDVDVTTGTFEWQSADLVYVAEYFVVEDGYDEVHTYEHVSGEFEKIYADQIDEELRIDLETRGAKLVSMRKIKSRKIRKYVLSGGGVLSDDGHISGCEIPVVPYYGKRWYIEGVERFMGHVRPAKDIQRLKNMQLSKLAQLSAESGDRVPIFVPEQVQGYEHHWAERSARHAAFLLLNPIFDPSSGQMIPQGPIGYTESSEVPQATAALMQLAEEDISDVLGGRREGEEIHSNLSGRAVELIQSRLDGQTYIYMSNFAKAVRRSAQIWLGMARDVYSGEGRVKIINESGAADYRDIGEVILGDDGTPKPKYDLSRAKFDVSVDIGPTSGSRRQAAISSLTAMLQFVVDPSDKKILTAAILSNIEGEGVGDVREYFRKQMVMLGASEPTQSDIDEMSRQQPPGPDAQQVYLMSEAQKNEAQALRAEAETEKVRAQTVETIAGIDRDDRQQAIDAARAISLAINGKG